MSNSPLSVFRSAISGDDGSVDPGYLAMYWVMLIVVSAVPFMCLGALWAMYLDPFHKFGVQELGIGVGAVCGGFATAIGAVGLFRMGDKQHANTVSTSTLNTKTEITAPAAPVDSVPPAAIAAPPSARPRKQAKSKRERIMKRQRGFGLVDLAIYAVIAVVVAGVAWKAWNSFKESIAKPYVDEQIKADQKVVNAANDERDDYKKRSEHAQADTAACVTAIAAQSTEVKKWQDEANKNFKAAQDAKAKALVATANEASMKAGYLAIVNAPPKKDETCQQQLSKVDKLLRDAARARQAK